MTVVQNYGLFFLFCYVRTLREPDFLKNLPDAQCAISKFYQFTKFYQSALSTYFCTFYTKLPTPAISAKCQTFLTTVSVTGRTFSPLYLYMEGTNGGQKNEQ